MGVCTEERPVMHWQQSARFLGPSGRQKSSTPPAGQERNSQCTSAADTNQDLQLCSTFPDICNRIGNSYGSTCIDTLKSYETAEHANFDDSTIKYSIIKSRIKCAEETIEPNSRISLKTEPYGLPSSPESTNENILLRNSSDCAGCGEGIQDRFYLSAVDKRWHINCLQCHACRRLLDRESSCFSRDGNIFCKKDYYSFFGTRRCSRCLASISPTELVMRAKNLVFHVSCFFCVICQIPLSKGDHYGIIGALIYCKTHYNIAKEGDSSSSHVGCSFQYSTQFDSPQNESSSPQLDSNRIVPTGMYVPTQHVISGLPQPQRQKGRPRKRKPKDIETLTANIDLNTEYLDFSRGSHMSASSRTKRMRTSFKHHQLRTMKSYFAINHNPDAKDLKQLSQKTGLPKRVLQVWFQNARAKWRRMMMKQDGNIISEKGDGSLDLDSVSAQSPSSFIMRRTSCSPPQSLD